MDNFEKSCLEQMCKLGSTFNYIKKRVVCSDATIKRYMKIFSPPKNQSEHTPGPWYYQEESDAYTHIVRAKKNKFLFQLSQDPSGESEADARLMAAAPEMKDGIIKVYKEFTRIKNLKTTSLRDTIYLNGVLAVLDTYLKPSLEKATRKSIDKIIGETK